MFQTTLHAQPQYRVVLDPPVTVLATGGVQPTHVTVCFREGTSVSDDLDYCPLGQLTLGLLIGVLLATVLTLLVNNMAICWCLRRQRRKAGQRRNKQG